MHMYHNFFIHSSASGHLGWFHVLAIVNSATMNNGGTCVSFNSDFLKILAQQWDFWVVWQFYSQLFYPFICQWTSRLLPFPSCCKQYCNELWGTRVSFNSGFLGVYAQQWDCWVVWQFYFQFFKESPHYSL